MRLEARQRDSWPSGNLCQYGLVFGHRQSSNLAHDDEGWTGIAARGVNRSEPRQVDQSALRNALVEARSVLDDGDWGLGGNARVQKTVAHGSGFRGAHVDDVRLAARRLVGIATGTKRERGGNPAMC